MSIGRGMLDRAKEITASAGQVCRLTRSGREKELWIHEGNLYSIEVIVTDHGTDNVEVAFTDAWRELEESASDRASRVSRIHHERNPR